MFSLSTLPQSVSTFYPPLDSLSYITNASLGPYGGIYSAPRTSPSPHSDDGAYDYCSMPHPSEGLYSLPSPVANQSVQAELVYLEYLQRHQRRTPYNILPSGEVSESTQPLLDAKANAYKNQEYHCDDIRPYLFAATSAESPLSVPVYAQSYTDPANPFVATYVNGSCQYPQLTIGGLLDGYQHGVDLWNIYGEKLHFLPTIPDQNKVWFRSSSSALTQGTAGGVLRGIWPDYQGSLKLHQQASSIDTVDQSFPCPARSRLLSAIQSTDQWDEHLDVTQTLRERLATMFNANISSWLSTADHFADNFQARLCNEYHLPCRHLNESDCVTPTEAYDIFRTSDWEWNYWWRRHPSSARYIQLTAGLFIGEILGRLGAAGRGESSLVYSHNFVHDGDIGPVLGALGVQALRWPGMGSNIAFEVW
jgi:hypothetical protein